MLCMFIDITQLHVYEQFSEAQILNEPPHGKTNILTHLAYIANGNQRTNGPVNAHLKPEIYTNKLV